ncbi:uncharacterized protein LOC107270985 isoform X2 [Cephus cinctus]|uniref:exodeoxyribonuclease III n=1 Tax=Cephus cinctus TaxID=211228 RepID=A0AAJ7W472_CEPCN|nr:uncharacterized protein LOC107270985 isoform X2 [Cephus cinctus]
MKYSIMPPKKKSSMKVTKATKATKASTSASKDDKDKKPLAKVFMKKTKREEEDIEEPPAKKAKTDAKKLMNKTDSNLDEISFDCDKLNAKGEKYNIKICSWNVSGIRACIKKNALDYIKKEDADIVVLQETKCDTNKLPPEVKLKGYHHYFLDSKKPGYCGVALYSKEKALRVTYGLADSECNDEGRLITAEYKNFYIVNVYVPNAGQKLVTMPKRLRWNEDFKNYIKKLDKEKSVIVCGDMNVAHQEIDLKNPKSNTRNAGFTKEERDGMTDFLEQGFVDTFRALYPDRIDAYTYWSYFQNARSKNIGWRLDYFLVSERIKNCICDCVIRDKIYGSDHCPIILYANL